MELGGIQNRDFYSLRVDILFYDKDLLTISMMDRMVSFLVDFMGDRGEWKKLSVLQSKPITNPDYHKNAIMRDMELDGYYFGKGTSYKDGEPIGIHMDQPITIAYKENPGSFSKLFPFRLLQVCGENRKWVQTKSAEERLKEFLEIHLLESFDNDVPRFKSFLLSLQGASNELMRDFMDSIKLWLDGKGSKTKNDEKNDYSELRLETLIKPITKWIALRNILVKEEIISPISFNWIDKLKGYKERIAAFILTLERKGYFGTKSLNTQEVSALIKNSFGIEVTPKTVGNSFGSDKHKEFEFIPHSSVIS